MNAIDRDDAEKKIAEIREALEKATPGPWVAVDEIATVYSANADVVIEYSADEREEDIRLIANAPEWLGFLMDELERANRERDKLIERLKCLIKELYQMSIEEYRKWRNEGDPMARGMSDGYEIPANRLIDILQEFGVTVE